MTPSVANLQAFGIQYLRSITDPPICEFVAQGRASPHTPLVDLRTSDERVVGRSAMGHKQTLQGASRMSALPPESRHVRRRNRCLLCAMSRHARYTLGVFWLRFKTDTSRIRVCCHQAESLRVCLRMSWAPQHPELVGNLVEAALARTSTRNFQSTVR